MKDRDRRPRSGEQPHHSPSEVANFFASQGLVEDWIKTREPSNAAIARIYSRLLHGSFDIDKDRPVSPRRTQWVGIKGKSRNFLVSHLDILPAMHEYEQELDEILAKEAHVIAPEINLEDTIHDAAWAYYVYERIHPGVDGNGRMGRNILKRVMKGRGYPDILFQPNAAYGAKRPEHLVVLDRVGDTGNLAHLEKYLLEQMRGSYPKDSSMPTIIEELITKKHAETVGQEKKQSIRAIWIHFAAYLPNY